MTTMSADLAPGVGRRPGGHCGAWRAAAAAPAMVGSLLLLVVLFGWLGRWESVVLTGWLLSGVAVLTRPGERVAVRLGSGFRQPTTAQAATLAPLWSAALQRCRVDPRDVDLYVQRTPQPNASANGGRSVAVTTGVVAEFQAHRLAGDVLVGVLAHELGHHATRATRFTLVTVWLAAPWRFACRLLIGVGLAMFGRQPRRLLAAVVVAGVVVAVVQAVQQRQWTVALVLGGVALAAVACPLLDAAVSRRGEFTADRYAAAAGLGPELAAALQTLDRRGSRRRGWTARALAHHPDLDRRVAALCNRSLPRFSGGDADWRRR